MTHLYPLPPGLVAAITYEGLCTFEFGIAVELFGLPRPEFEFPWYDFETVPVERKRVRATAGVVVEATGVIDTLDRANTIVIPGWRGSDAAPPAVLIDKLRCAHERGARLVSICSGVHVLAQAGLLEHKEATTHWRYIHEARARYPNIRFVDNVLYVQSGNIITSAGSSAGIDACLHLIRADFGSRIANRVARRLVMPPHREGGQQQYVVSPMQQHHGCAISRVMEWARERLSKQIQVPQLARQAAMSERTFLRRFRATTGLTPTTWLQRERMFAAQELLEASTLPLQKIAMRCGYYSYETFRSTFKRHVGIAPGVYRSRFHADPT